jgi:hypothetical protein
VDCDATGLAFVDEEFARQNRRELLPLHESRALEVIDGRQISSGAITQGRHFHAVLDALVIAHTELVRPPPDDKYADFIAQLHLVFNSDPLECGVERPLLTAVVKARRC